MVAISHNARTAITLGVIAVGAYLLYKWYTNRSSSTGFGTNLNSTAPELTAGSTGPNSGLDYNAGTTNITVTEPATSTSTGTGPSDKPGDKDKHPKPPHKPGGFNGGNPPHVPVPRPPHKPIPFKPAPRKPVKK